MVRFNGNRMDNIYKLPLVFDPQPERRVDNYTPILPSANRQQRPFSYGNVDSSRSRMRYREVTKKLRNLGCQT
jgi:hypothetical protein